SSRSPSITSADPTWRRLISCAASATVAPDATVVRSLLIPSRTAVMSDPEPSRRREAAEALLDWYRPLRRRYPWRGTRDPYAVWVSEVMLQQTQAARVAAPFEAFMGRFPDVARLAAPRRAVSLPRAARLLVDEHGGRIPRDVETLRSLPGIGSYTANAIA